MSYQLPTLPFEYDALEPFIDARTMEIHHSRHHQGYVNKLNKALEGTEFKNTSIEKILANASNLPDAIRNNGGGHYNHNLYWEILSPNNKDKPGGALANAIDNSFHSFESFKDIFSKVAASRFGSGWAWLVITRHTNELAITSTPNQDNPLMDIADIQGIPILGLDVWEHAYYLNYQNNRSDYIDAFWNIVDWEAVEENFTEAQKTTWDKILRYTTVAFHHDSIDQ